MSKRWMRGPLATGVVVSALALTGGCSNGGMLSDDDEPDPVLDAAVDDVEIPTEEEAAEEAAATITPENADAEFERLTSEIEGELDEN